MQNGKQALPIGLILLAVFTLALLSLGAKLSWATADFSTEAVGRAALPGPMQFDLTISPPIVAPGQTAVLNLTLTNNSPADLMPTVTLQLPPGLSLDARALPSGTSLNMQTGALVWQPLVAANSQRRLTADVRIQMADLTKPQRLIEATIQLDGATQTAVASLWVGMPPQAQVKFSLPQAAVGQPVQLIAETYSPGPYSQLWDLGDGRMVDADNPTVVYPLPGEYEVKLHIANPLATVVIPARLTVTAEPAADFELERSGASVNEPFTFYNLSGGQPPLRYSWDFGDGRTSSERHPRHAYEQPGLYQARLIVENDYGRDEITIPVPVGYPPLADLILEPFGRTGEPLRGQAFGDGSVTDFEWRMGDGQTLTGEFVQYVYRQPGNYWVTMTAVNQFGRTEVGRWVVVEQGDSYLYLPFLTHNLAAHGVNPAELSLETGASTLETAAPLPDASAPLTERETITPFNFPLNTAGAEQLFYYINAARHQNGLPPLNYAHPLTVAAQRHTEDMAINRFTGHTGSDGSSPAQRLLMHGYPGGYLGEATAWGMERAIQAVEFWLNSPPHRRILLNPEALEVGVGYTIDFNAPNVWYWTAEFGNPNMRPNVQPHTPNAVLQLSSPAPDSRFTTGLAPLTFSWQWGNRLTAQEQFVVYLVGDDGRPLPIGTVYSPASGQQYELVVPGGNLIPGVYTWHVQLQTRDGATRLNSESWPLTLLRAGEQPIVTPTAAPAAPPPPAAPTPAPTLAPLPTAAP
jgi:uncharacterized protein YkwD/PKD repeat protein